MEKVCEEKHKRIDEKVSNYEERLNGHSKRLDNLEKICAEDRVLINNLCREIESLVITIKWLCGPILFGMIGFFFYAIQQGL